MRITKMAAGLAGFALVLAACGNQATSESAAPSGGGGGGDRSDITIEVVVHGQASDPFWSVVANGVEEAAAASASRPTTAHQPPTTSMLSRWPS